MTHESESVTFVHKYLGYLTFEVLSISRILAYIFGISYKFTRSVLPNTLIWLWIHKIGVAFKYWIGLFWIFELCLCYKSWVAGVVELKRVQHALERQFGMHISQCVNNPKNILLSCLNMLNMFDVIGCVWSLFHFYVKIPQILFLLRLLRWRDFNFD